MQTAILNATPRSRGKKSERKAGRREGLVPVVLYGSGEEAELLNIRNDALAPVMKMGQGTTLLIDLNVEGRAGGAVKTVIRDVQRHPTSRQILHCDLLKVDLSRKYNVTVPIVLEGEPIGVKTFGGLLAVHQREVEILCRPEEIPESYVIDISDMGVGDSIRLEDVEKKGEEEFVTAVETTIATVAIPRVEEEKPAEEEGEPAEGEEGEKAEEGEEKKVEDGEGEKSEEK